MFKLLILLTVAALSSANDYDKLVGEWTLIAKAKPPGTCDGFIVNKSNDKCICDGKEIPVLTLKEHSGSEDHKYIPFLVSSDDEVNAALSKKAEDCSCGEKLSFKHVLRVLSDGYVAVYAPSDNEKHVSAVLAKTGTSKSDIEAFLKNSEYKEAVPLPCDLSS